VWTKTSNLVISRFPPSTRRSGLARPRNEPPHVLDRGDCGGIRVGTRKQFGRQIAPVTGLAQGGNYRFVGPSGFAIAAASGGYGTSCPVVRYPLAVPVVGGNTINVEAIMLGEDCGTINVSAILVFSDKPAPGGYVDADLREGDIAAVDTDTALVAIGTDALGTPRVPTNRTRLGAIVVGFGCDYGVLTAGMMGQMVAYLRGDGLKLGGTYRVLAAASMVLSNTTGAAAALVGPEIFELNVPLVPGNTLELHAMAIAELAGAYTAIMGVLYR
jgi:hypothetical protein